MDLLKMSKFFYFFLFFFLTFTSFILSKKGTDDTADQVNEKIPDDFMSFFVPNKDLSLNDLEATLSNIFNSSTPSNDTDNNIFQTGTNLIKQLAQMSNKVMEEDMSINSVLKGIVENPIAWINKMMKQYTNKTLIFANLKTQKNEVDNLEKLFSSYGAKVQGSPKDRDVIVLNLSSPEVADNDIRIVKMLEITQEWLKKEWDGKLPAVFSKGVYISDVEKTMKAAITKYGALSKLANRKLKNILIKTQFDIYNIFCENMSVTSFIDRLVKSNGRNKQAVLLVKWSSGLTHVAYELIQSLSPAENRVKFIDLDNNKLYDSVLTDTTPLHIKKKRVFENLLNVSNFNLLLGGPFLFLNGKRATANVSVMKTFFDQCKIEILAEKQGKNIESSINLVQQEISSLKNVKTKLTNEIKENQKLLEDQYELEEEDDEFYDAENKKQLAEKIIRQSNEKIDESDKKLSQLQNRLSSLKADALKVSEERKKNDKAPRPKGAKKRLVKVNGKSLLIPEVPGDQSVSEDEAEEIFNCVWSKIQLHDEIAGKFVGMMGLDKIDIMSILGNSNIFSK